MSKGYSVAIAANPYVVGSFACIGGGLVGLDISSMSGVLNNEAYFEVFNHPGSNAQGAIVAAMPAGSFVGSLAVSHFADRFGRKMVIILSGLVWIVGSILQCAAQNRGMLVVGRVISGLAVGLVSTTVPIYQAEITTPSIRGSMIALQQWSITWGMLVQYLVQFGCSYPPSHFLSACAGSPSLAGLSIMDAKTGLCGISPAFMARMGRTVRNSMAEAARLRWCTLVGRPQNHTKTTPDHLMSRRSSRLLEPFLLVIQHFPDVYLERGQ